MNLKKKVVMNKGDKQTLKLVIVFLMGYKAIIPKILDNKLSEGLVETIDDLVMKLNIMIDGGSNDK